MNLPVVFFSNFSPILLPLQSSMTVTLPSSTDNLSSHNPFPGNLVFIKRFEDTVIIVYILSFTNSKDLDYVAFHQGLYCL